LGELHYSGSLDFAPPGCFFLREDDIVYLLYLDDSGSAKNQNEEYLVLGGISVFERQAYFLSQRLDNVASALGASPLDELHASEIHHGKRTPWAGRPRKEREQAVCDVLQVLGDDTY
jgi:hypothetical protein